MRAIIKKKQKKTHVQLGVLQGSVSGVKDQSGQSMAYLSVSFPPSGRLMRLEADLSGRPLVKNAAR